METFKLAMDYPDGATPLDPDEMQGLKFPHITSRAQLDQMEQVNVQDGLRWLYRSKHHDILTDQFVRQLHTKLFGNVWEWAGTFRKTEKNIGIDPVQISQQLRLLLEDVQYWLVNDSYPPYELALRFHHRMVKIHPFPNGNGRHARIMADMLLVQMLEQKPIDWKARSLDKASAIRKNYINALREADKGKYEALLSLYSAD